MGRVVGWCLAGLGGAAIGWFARGAFPAARAEPDARTAETDAAGTAPVPGLAAGTAPGTASTSAPAAAEPSPPLGASGGPAKPSPRKPNVDEALVELRAALGESDTRRLQRAVAALGDADDPRGDAALVATMADLSMPLPPIGEELQRALATSEAPGIAAAARARIAAALENNEGAWHHFKGWVDLVARHGSDADLEWLGGDALRSQEGWALPAVARTGNATAAKILGRHLEAGTSYEMAEAIGEFAKVRPDAAWPLALLRPSRETIGAYANSAPLEALAPVETWLRTRPDDESRIEAVYVVSVLERRGRDVSGLSAVTEAPVRFLARIAAGEVITERNRSLLNAAGYAIEYNRITWSENAARTLEAADVALDAAGITVGGPDYPHVARIVRDGLKKRWN